MDRRGRARGGRVAGRPWQVGQSRLSSLHFLMLALLASSCMDSHLPEGITSPLPGVGGGHGQEHGADVIVTLEPRTDPGQFARSLGVEPTYIYTHVMNGFAGRISDLAREGLLRDYRVVRIDQDREFRLTSETQPDAPWGLDRIDQRSPVLNGAYTYMATGSGVTAYIVDTGIRYSHSDFGGRASFGYDALGGDGSDCHGHGTHVAGTVGGSTFGVAKDVALVAVRVLNCGGVANSSTIIAGLDWIAANAVRPAVVNMSLGGAAHDRVDAAVQSIIDAGIAVAVAAGNSGHNACDYTPGRVPDAMTTAATDEADQKPSWSNWGSCVDWFAPGVDILSAAIESDNATNTKSGTSMAAPHTTGVAALYLQTHPTASPAQVASALAGMATSGVVASASTAANDLLYALDDGSDGGGGNAPPVADFSFSCAGNTCEFFEQATDADGTVVDYQWDFGDGPGGNVPNPTHTYDQPGTYQVSLIVRDDDGAVGGTARQVTITTADSNLPPNAAFSVICSELHCEFRDGSSDGDGTITAWEWHFGDGDGSSEQDPSHTYASAGTFTAELIVHDDDGATSSATLQVTATSASNLPPTAAFTANCAGLSCAFQDGSTDLDGTISHWQWDFGDGNGISRQAAEGISHTFSVSGTYTVTLTVTDDTGASGTASQEQPVGLILTTSGYKVKGRHAIEFQWNGAESAEVDIFVDGVLVDTTPNSGGYSHFTDNRGQGEYSLRVCESGTSTCSPIATVSF